MNCERFEDLLPDYLAGTLRHEDEDRFEDHMEACARCKETVTLWNRLAELPEEQPSPALRARFESMLQAQQDAEAARVAMLPRRTLLPFLAGGNWMQAAASVAFAIVLLAAGFAFGRYSSRASNGSGEEIARLRDDLRDMKQLAMLTMLQQQSAADRLQAVTMGAQAPQLDPQVQAALLQTLRSDSSVDVRLAALNALSRHSSQPAVRAGLLDALQPRQSPLVQVALIDLLVEMRDRQAVPQLEKVQQNPQLNPAVRQRAELALRQLN